MSTHEVFDRRCHFAQAVCDIRVVQTTTSQGEPTFRAAAYETTEEPNAELHPVTNDEGEAFEVFAATPANAADRLVDLLELRYGARQPQPEDGV